MNLRYILLYVELFCMMYSIYNYISADELLENKSAAGCKESQF